MTRRTDLRRVLEPPACWRGPLAAVSEWMRWACHTVGQALADAAARPTRLTPLGPGGERPVQAAFTVAATIRPSASEASGADAPVRVVVSLDGGAAQAVVDAVVSQLCGFRSGGVLTDAYRVALEHVTLEVLDRLSVAGDFAGTLTFDGCAWGPETACSLPQGGFRELVRLHVGALCGTLEVSIGPLAGGTMQVLPSTLCADVGDPPDTSTAIAVRAPHVRLPRADLEQVRPGDALYAGFTDGLGIGCGCRLVTESGWDLGAVDVRHHSPTALEVAFDPAPAVPDAAPDASDDPVEARVVNVRPLLGQSLLSQRELATLLAASADARPTIRLDARPASSAPVRLYHRHRPWATAELVRVDGEAAYRILAIDPSLLQR